MAEWVNRELKRHTKVVGIFPSPESCERLVTAVLIEISEEWETKTNLIMSRAAGGSALRTLDI